MVTIKIFTICISVILCFFLLLFAIYLTTKSFKSKLNNDGKIKISFGIWYAALFLCGANIISSIINTIFEVIDNIIKIHPEKIYQELVKSISLIIGVGFTWFILWLFVVKFLIKITRLKTDEDQEMEDDNFAYFIIKAAMLIGSVFGLSPLFALLLRLFIPNVETLFFH